MLVRDVCAGQRQQCDAVGRTCRYLAEPARSHFAPRTGHPAARWRDGDRGVHRGDELGLGELADIG